MPFLAHLEFQCKLSNSTLAAGYMLLFHSQVESFVFVPIKVNQKHKKDNFYRAPDACFELQNII